MAVTTYLLGAGASVGSIPTIENLNEDLKTFQGFLQSFLPSFPISPTFTDKVSYTSVSYYDILNNVIADLTWLYNNNSLHSSIDTFAKKLFLKGENENLEKLKSLLSFYFSYKQNNNNVDQRYDNLYASILQRSINDFPKKLRIISWNYDNQLEFAFSNFCDSNDIPSIRSQITLIPKNTDHFYADEADKFSIFKLNGSAGILNHKGDYSYFGHIKQYALQNSRAYDELYSCIESYYYSTKYFNHKEKLLRTKAAIEFAWEKNLNSDYFKLLEKSLAATDTLVVIGYSFPFFNRSIDDYLLNNCMFGSLHIYIQDPDAVIVKKRIEAIRGNRNHTFDLFDKIDNKQFVFPSEIQL